MVKVAVLLADGFEEIEALMEQKEEISIASLSSLKRRFASS